MQRDDAGIDPRNSSSDVITASGEFFSKNLNRRSRAGIIRGAAKRDMARSAPATASAKGRLSSQRGEIGRNSMISRNYSKHANLPSVFRLKNAGLARAISRHSRNSFGAAPRRGRAKGVHFADEKGREAARDSLGSLSRYRSAA